MSHEDPEEYDNDLYDEEIEAKKEEE